MKRKMNLLLPCLFLFFAFASSTVCPAQGLRTEDSLYSEIRMLVDRFYNPLVFAKNVEPDFKAIEKSALLKFGQVGEQVVWDMIAFRFYVNYHKSQNETDLAGWFNYKRKLNKKYPDFLDTRTLNNDAWLIFQKANDKNKLKTALLWSKRTLNREPGVGNWHDTYANLLYKLGRKKEALIYEEKAVKLDPYHQGIMANYQRMLLETNPNNKQQ